jgi:GH18 family chitinase
MKMKRLIIIGGLLIAGLNAAAGTEKIVGGYYATEKWGMDKLPVGKIDFSSYNFIFQAFLKAKEDGSLILVPGRYPCAELVKLAHQNGAKVIISLGGGSFKLFPQICAGPEKFKRFVDGVAGFVEQNDYDGVDLDWEGSITLEQGKLWNSLIRELRLKMDQIGERGKRKMYVFTALPCGSWFTGKLDPEVLRTQLDFINLMAYDQGSQTAGYHAALEPAADDPNKVGSVKTLKYLTEELKIPREKICFGLPFYAYVYENCSRYEKVPKNDPIKKVTALGWNEIARLLAGDWKREYDPVTRAARYTSPDGKIIIPADDPQSIADKTAWAKAGGYSGVFCWAMHHDAMPDGSAPLAKAMRQSWNSR